MDIAGDGVHFTGRIPGFGGDGGFNPFHDDYDHHSHHDYDGPQTVNNNHITNNYNYDSNNDHRMGYDEANYR